MIAIERGVHVVLFAGCITVCGPAFHKPPYQLFLRNRRPLLFSPKNWNRPTGRTIIILTSLLTVGNVFFTICELNSRKSPQRPQDLKNRIECFLLLCKSPQRPQDLKNRTKCFLLLSVTREQKALTFNVCGRSNEGHWVDFFQESQFAYLFWRHFKVMPKPNFVSKPKLLESQTD